MKERRTQARARGGLLGLISCALVATVPAQTVVHDLELAEHERSVRAERAALLREAFRAAEPGLRLDARLAFEARRSSGAATLSPAPLRTVAYVAGELTGRLDHEDELSPAERAWWVAQAIDLRPRPGLFAARDEGLGEPTTVAVSALWPIEFEGNVFVELHWVDPDGERQLARREPFAPSAFITGFEMAVRPPVSEPAGWRLEPSVELAGHRARGAGVRVACIRTPKERVRRTIESLAEDADPSTLPVRRALAALVPWHDMGRRDGLFDPIEAFALIDAWSGREDATTWLPSGALRPWGPSSPGLAEGFVYEPQRAAEQPIEGVVAIAVASHEAAYGPWLGTDGAELRRLADEHAVRVVTLRLEPGWAPLGDEVVEHLRTLAAGGDWVLVARGDAAGRLPAQQPDALVLCSYFPAAPPLQLDGDAEVLVVSPLGDRAHQAWATGEAGPNVTWSEGEREPSLSWVPLQDALARWMRDRSREQ